MEALIDLLLEKAAGLLGGEVCDLKQMAYANNLGWLWDFARDYLFNYKIWTLGSSRLSSWSSTGPSSARDWSHRT